MVHWGICINFRLCRQRRGSSEVIGNVGDANVVRQPVNQASVAARTRFVICDNAFHD